MSSFEEIFDDRPPQKDEWKASTPSAPKELNLEFEETDNSSEKIEHDAFVIEVAGDLDAYVTKGDDIVKSDRQVYVHTTTGRDSAPNHVFADMVKAVLAKGASVLPPLTRDKTVQLAATKEQLDALDLAIWKWAGMRGVLVK
jgi:hypothetical protein